jgi:acetaldehyde dehydrogenase / alcohol dehydrogenase
VTTVIEDDLQLEQVNEMVERTRRAQQIYATFSQADVDRIFRAAALAAAAARIPLARAAAEETRLGIMEDKVIKNHYAAEYIYHAYKDTQTCGVVEDDRTFGFRKVAEPIGLVAGIVPTTNPTSTVIFKSLLALKTRNGIIFGPHPRAKKCSCMAAKLIHDAAVAAGAPKDIISWIDEPTVALSSHLMRHPDINLILATGGPGMVKAAYSSGKPAIGVGAGNTPVIVDETADLKMAVSSILMSKTFDNGVICASEQSVVVAAQVYDEVRAEFQRRGAYFVVGAEKDKLAKLVIVDGHINADIVGQPASKIAEMAGFTVPANTKVLIAEISEVGPQEPFSYEKLSPVLALYKADDFAQAVELARALITFGGQGHTSVLYTDPVNADRIKTFEAAAITGRVLINMPASQGAIGDLYNFKLPPSLTLGCGSWGGNSVSENIGVKHLLNYKQIAERRENMLWFRVPPKIYFKPGSLKLGLDEMKGRKRAVIISDKVMDQLGYVRKVSAILEENGLNVRVFSDVLPDPDITTTNRALEMVNAFQPDLLISLGGGSPMDAAKIVWLMYENPELKFEDIAMRFLDIRKRIVEFPKLGKKAYMVAIPTTSGTGSEVTPFSVITDDATGAKYPIADYELTPDMAIVDPDLVLTMPKGLCAASGVDALTHAVEAFTSVFASNFADGHAMEAARLIFKYLPASYNEGAANPLAREKIHYAATIAGMAFANAFLGVCHSMAHKLGAAFHVPHGIANALLISHVIRYNATDVPTKQGLLPQYKYPWVKGRYARLADSLGLTDGIAENDRDAKVSALIAAIEKLKAELNIPKSIREAGVSAADFYAKLDAMSEDAFDDQCTGGNPRFPLIEEIRALYIKAFEGEKP